MGMNLIVRNNVSLAPMAPGIERIKGFFPPSFLALQTTRLGGSSQAPYDLFNLATHVGDDPALVAANRARLASHLPAKPLWLHQVHGTQVAECDEGDECMPRDADAGIAHSTGVAAVIMTADCLPILVARAATGQCAAIHAGWKGLAAGVIEATLNRMALMPAKAGVDRDDWWLWMGPAIGPEAFEVGGDVVNAFVAPDPDAIQAFSELKAQSEGRPQKWMADLKLLARLKLERWAKDFRGAATLTVACSNECVYSDAVRYFSFRRDRVTGRMASLICRLS
jgi:YfiH family protein